MPKNKKVAMNDIITPNNNSVTSFFGKIKHHFMDIPWYIWTIVFVGFVLRIYQIASNLPFVTYTDESLFVWRAIYCGTGDLNPYPLMPYAFHIYILFLLYSALASIAFILGIFHSVWDVAKLYLTNPSFFYISGRLASALMGTATIYITYRLGKLVYSKRVGIVAASLLTFFPTHVLYSHIVAYQIPAMLFILLSIWRIFKISNVTTASSTIKEYLVTGFLIGISISTHPSGFLLLVPFVVSHALRVYGGNKPFHIQHYVFNRTLFIGLGAILFGMFIGSPFYFIDYRNGILSYLPSYMTGQIDPTRTISREGYILPWLAILTDKVGYLLTATIIISFLYIIVSSLYKVRRQTKFDWIAFSFVSAYIFALVYITRREERDLLPIVPLLMLFVGVLLDDVMLFFKNRFHRAPGWVGTSIYVIGVIILLAFPVRNVFNIEREFSKIDTRSILSDWVKRNIPPGTTMVTEAWIIKLDPDTETVNEKMRALEAFGGGKSESVIQAYSYYLETGASQRGYKLVSTTQYDANLLFGILPYVPQDYEIDRFKDTKYFIFLQENIDRAREKPQEHFRLPLYEWIQQNADLVKLLKPSGNVKGPEILVFKRRLI